MDGFTTKLGCTNSYFSGSLQSLANMVKVVKKKRVPKTRALTPPPTLPQDPLERAIVKLEVDEIGRAHV